MMTTSTMERINKLSGERSKLYRLASNGHRGDADTRRRIDDLTRELDTLWHRRRQERAGHREGIDLLVDRAYEQLYGSGFDNAVAPARVSATEDKPAAQAA